MIDETINQHLIEPESKEEKKTKELPILIPRQKCYGKWSSVGEAIVGMAHRRGLVPIVCQDAYCIGDSDRLVVVVCDGAGSSVLSEVGSQQLSQSVVRILHSLEPVIASLLDTTEGTKIGNKLAEIIYRYSIRLLQDIAVNYKRESRDFRTTLLLTVFGTENAFWYKVGDGEIIIENDGKLVCVGKSLKGEYSNETVFVDSGLKIQDVQYGLLLTGSVSGIALMSDGCAERLISTDRLTIADRLSTYFDLLRNEKLPREELYKFLNDYEVWRASTHDDKTLVLASRKEVK
jgi:hypothetical protein